MTKIGQRFGRLECIGLDVSRDKGKIRDLFRCDCGVEKEIVRSYVRHGNTASCGCYRRETSRSRRVKHDMFGTPEYKTWDGIKQRCYNANSSGYVRYGAFGIQMSDSWFNSFEAFYGDMGPRPEGTSIDRIDGMKGYSKENCRWATDREQQNNISTNRRVDFQGENKTLMEWSRIVGKRWHLLKDRLNRGWSVEEAFNTQVGVKRGQGK